MNLTSPTPERPAAAGKAEPAEEKPGQLPERVEPEASRHDGIALEMAREEPQLRLDVELGAHAAFAMGAARFADVGDAVEHQHRRQRQLGVSRAEQLSAAAGQKVFVGELGAPFGHALVDSLMDAVAPRAGLFIGLVTQARASRKRSASILLSNRASGAGGRGCGQAGGSASAAGEVGFSLGKSGSRLSRRVG